MNSKTTSLLYQPRQLERKKKNVIEPKKYLIKNIINIYFLKS